MATRPRSFKKPVRALLLVLTLLLTSAATLGFFFVIFGDGGGFVDLALVGLFGFLFLWVAFSFWSASLGFLKCLVMGPPRAAGFSPTKPGTTEKHTFPRVAVLMPIYNESPGRVFDGLRALHDSLRELGYGDTIDLFILSDTTKPDVWLEEELEWSSLVNSVRGNHRIFYRHRRQNTARKSGNIEDFVARYSGHYEYMVVFDADSIMAADTVLEMVRRMQADRRIGILQVPPVPIHRTSLFARFQEFTASAAGRIFSAGFALWADIDGNYFGHNAIIRCDLFAKHCGLPKLPGPEPLGGEILSHDFVEAALIRRAGYKVVVADDLGGSYEESPTTLTDYLKRDQRWCQGNLQHLRLVPLRGFRTISRLHFAMGAMSYLASPLWLLFLALGGFSALCAKHNIGLEFIGPVAVPSWLGGMAPGALALVLYAVTMGLLLLPHLWTFLLMLKERRRRTEHGGALRVARSLVLSVVLSTLMAPLMMLYHTLFVLNALVGRSVQWNAQSRDEVGLTWAQATADHLGVTLGGVAMLLLALAFIPELVPWSTPLFLGLLLSIPLAKTLASVYAGMWFRALGFFLSPIDANAPRVVGHQIRHQSRRERAKRDRKAPASVDLFTQAVLDPAFNALHIDILRATGEMAPAADIERLRQVALAGGPEFLQDKHKRALLGDPEAMAWLHTQAWAQWPIETLRAATDVKLFETRAANLMMARPAHELRQG